MQVQLFLQLTPGSPSLETDNVSGCLHTAHNTVSPLPIRLIKLRCSLNDLAVDLLIAEKSSFVIVTLLFYL